MSRKVGWLIVPALIVGALGVWNLTVVPHPASATSATGAQTLRLTIVTTKFRSIDSGKKGPSVGDTFVSADRVYQRGTRKLLGHAVGIGTVTSWTGTGANTRAAGVTGIFTIHLGDGKVVLGGAINFASSVTRSAVLGGTGAYRDARGSATIRPERGKSDVTIRLIG
jgi:hypothetical protein